jgi:uncharacterized protein YeaO (DUF488 family)
MKKLILIFAVLLLSGCSAKFVYNNVEWLAYWYVDDFIELTDEQEVEVDKKLTAWMQWHREQELPKYLAHLNELSSDIASQSISMERMDYHQEKLRGHWERVKIHIIPDLVELSPMLNDEQIESMFAEIDRQNEEEAEERAEHMEKSPEKRKRESIKRNKKNLKRWLGKLSSEQETLIENMHGKYHNNGALWQAYRERYQAELKLHFQSNDRGEAFQNRLQELLLKPEVFRGEELNRRNDENAATYKSFLQAVDALATEKQRNHLVDEITEFGEDITDLMAP